MTTPYTVPIKIGNLAGGPLLPIMPVVDSVADHSVFPGVAAGASGYRAVGKYDF